MVTGTSTVGGLEKIDATQSRLRATRALAKKFRQITGKEVSHTEVLSAIPDFELARPIFELMIRSAPRRTHYAFVLVQIDNLDELEDDGDTEGVLVRLAEGLRRYVEENHTLAACTRNGEFAILLEDVDAMDEDDETLGWFSKALPFKRQPDQPEVMITALVTDVGFNDPNEDPMLLERIEVTRESFKEYNEMRSQMRFVWGPAGF